MRSKQKTPCGALSLGQADAGRETARRKCRICLQMWSPPQTKSIFYRKAKLSSIDSYTFSKSFRFHHAFCALAGSFSYHTGSHANYQPKLILAGASVISWVQNRREPIKNPCMKACSFPVLSEIRTFCRKCPYSDRAKAVILRNTERVNSDAKTVRCFDLTVSRSMMKDRRYADQSINPGKPRTIRLPPEQRHCPAVK